MDRQHKKESFRHWYSSLMDQWSDYFSTGRSSRPRKSTTHFSKEDKLLMHYIRNQKENNFSDTAIQNHLITHQYEKKRVRKLLQFINRVEQEKERLLSFYTKVTIGLFFILILFFYLLSAALLVETSFLLVTFSPLLFSTVFALGIFSSSHIKNNTLVWFIPLIAIALFIYLETTTQFLGIDIGSALLVNLFLSYVMIGIFYFLSIDKNKRLMLYDDDEIAFIQLRRKKKLRSRNHSP